MKAVAILFGRAGSRGLPGKNTMPILGRPCCTHAMRAATVAGLPLIVSTDDPEIRRLARVYGAGVIDRPAHLSAADSPLEDAIEHAWQIVRDGDAANGIRADYVVILQANAPCITPDAIRGALAMLKADPSLDSVITASEMSGYAPNRARKLVGGVLVPNSDAPEATRMDSGPTYFSDGGATVVRADVLDRLRDQPGPYRWQGRRIGMVEQLAGPGDIDQPWQIAVAEWWLRQHGLREIEDAA